MKIIDQLWTKRLVESLVEGGGLAISCSICSETFSSWVVVAFFDPRVVHPRNPSTYSIRSDRHPPEKGVQRIAGSACRTLTKPALEKGPLPCYSHWSSDLNRGLVTSSSFPLDGLGLGLLPTCRSDGLLLGFALVLTTRVGADGLGVV